MDKELLVELRKYRYIRTIPVEEFTEAINSYGYKCDKWTVFKWENSKNRQVSKISTIQAYAKYYGINIGALFGEERYRYYVLRFDHYLNNVPYFRLSNKRIETDRIITNIAFFNLDGHDKPVVLSNAFYKSKTDIGFDKKLKEPLQTVYMRESYAARYFNLNEGTPVGYVIDLDEGFEKRYGHLFTYMGEKSEEKENFDYFNYIVNYLRKKFVCNEIIEYIDGYNFDGYNFEKTDDLKKAFFESESYTYMLYAIGDEILRYYFSDTDDDVDEIIRKIVKIDYIDSVCRWYLSDAINNAEIVPSRGEE